MHLGAHFSHHSVSGLPSELQAKLTVPRLSSQTFQTAFAQLGTSWEQEAVPSASLVLPFPLLLHLLAILIPRHTDASAWPLELHTSHLYAFDLGRLQKTLAGGPLQICRNLPHSQTDVTGCLMGKITEQGPSRTTV